MFYAIGIGQLCFLGWTYLFGANKRPVAKATGGKEKPRPAQLPQLVGAILILGLLLPGSEYLVPPTFQTLGVATAVNYWHESDIATQTPLDPEAFLQQTGAVAVEGRALYPRYYVADAGEPGGQWPAFNPLPFARLGFVLVGPESNHVVLPLQSSPTDFGNASDVVVFGCKEEGYLRAIAVVFIQAESQDVLSDFHTFSCDESR
jgi:hypothetical protein